MKLRIAVGLAACVGAVGARAQDAAVPLKTYPKYIPADSLLDPGRLHWIRYDLNAYRWTEATQTGDCKLGVVVAAATARADTADAKAQRAAAQIAAGKFAKCARPVSSADGFPGEVDYLYAEKFYRAAFDSAPASPRAFFRVATVLSERDRWRELESATRSHIRVASDDAWGWLVLGLTLHRQQADFHSVSAAFDSGFAHLAPPEIARLNHLERVLRPNDTTRIANLAPTAHSAIQKLYWTSADPLWSREGNEPHTEFLARVTFAELRWTVPEMGVRGADTDRGDVYIRYGPPDAVFAGRTTGRPCTVFPDNGAPYVFTSWVYYMRPNGIPVSLEAKLQDEDTGLKFAFCGQPMYATSYVPPLLQQTFGDIVAADPVRWDNIRAIAVDSMPARSTRFRASADSIDIVIATLPPFAGIRRVSTVASPIRSDVWILSGGVTSIAHDTSLISQPGVMSVRHRVPSGNYVYRAEASADGSQYAARATAAFGAGPDSTNAFRTRGFGISDVLIGVNANAPRTIRRWSDVTVQPIAGSVSAGTNLALVWESYDLGNDNGSAKYNVSITLEPQRSGVGRIAARIIGSVGGAVGIDRTDDRVNIHYERSAPFSPVLVDQLALSLAGTPAGQYRLTVAITDRVTNRSISRATVLIVRE